MDKRPNKLARVFVELEVMAQWVTCQRGRVGSALIDMEGTILVPARNGTAIRMPTCRELGADPTVRCPYCIHSEKNVINFAAKNGIATRGHDLVTLCRPCINCAQDIIQAGIAAVHYRWSYETDNALGGVQLVNRMFEEASVLFFQHKMSREEETFNKMINEWRTSWIDSK